MCSMKKSPLKFLGSWPPKSLKLIATFALGSGISRSTPLLLVDYLHKHSPPYRMFVHCQLSSH